MIAWLLTPDGYEADPVGFFANQIGHVMLGAALAAVLGPGLALLACLAWEAVHLYRGGALWDGCEDFGFVAAGVFAPVALPVALPMLAAGTLRRAF